MQIVQWLNQNPWLNLVFLLLAALSIALSIYLYIKSKREKLPCYNLRTFQLIEDRLSTIKTVEVLFQGQKIEDLAQSKVALWNKGKETINLTDVAPKDPLRIIVKPEYKLLTAEVVYVTNETNNFSITPNLEKGEVIINFDYFHTNEGVIIQLYHTGKDNDDIELSGTIKGTSNIKFLPPNADPITDSIVERITAPLPEPGEIRPTALKVIYVILVMLIFGPVIIGLTILLLPIDKLVKPLRKVPSEFELLE